MGTTARNVLIIMALAAVIVLLPGAGLAAAFFETLIGIVFLAGLAWFVARLYREHRVEILSMSDRWRLVLYGAIGVALLTVTATPQLWDTGPGTLLWIALIGAASYGLYAVYRAQQRY